MSVLDCYSTAYSEKDADLLDELYADDYLWVTVSPPRVEVWDRAKALRSARGMFAHPGVFTVDLTFGGAHVMMPGDAPGIWRIEGIEASLVTVFGKGALPDTARTCVTLYVRETDKGSGAFQVYREVTFGNSDCAAWSEGVRTD